MSNGFKNIVEGGYGLKPQSADPSNPKHGDYFHSDGTSRAEGLWHYINGGWSQVGSGNGDLSVYKQFDAEDGDTTGFTNITISSSSPIAGDNSYVVGSYPSNFPAVPMQVRHADKLHGIECHYNMTSGTAKLVVKDNSSNVLVEQEISSTSTQKASLQFYVNSAVTSVQLFMEDVSSAVGLKIDDVIFTDSPFVSQLLVDTQEYVLTQPNNAVTSATAELEFNLGTATIKNKGISLVTAANASGRTEFTAVSDCIVDAYASTLLLTVSRQVKFVIVKGSGDEYIFGSAIHSTNDPSTVSGSFELKAGEYFYLQTSVNNGTASSGDFFSGGAQIQSLSFTASAASENLVFSQSGTENKFSARIANNGTASITSQDVTYISTVNRDSQGVVTVNFVAGFFNTVPAIDATSEAAGRFASIASVSTSSVVLNFNDAAGTGQDCDFSIDCRNQGSDYKNPNAYATLQNAMVPFSAIIANNGTASITSQSLVPCIASINRFSAGIIDITFVSNFFSNPPSVMGMTDNGSRVVTYSNLSSTGVRITIQDSGVDQDNDFTLMIQKQG